MIGYRETWCWSCKGGVKTPLRFSVCPSAQTTPSNCPRTPGVPVPRATTEQGKAKSQPGAASWLYPAPLGQTAAGPSWEIHSSCILLAAKAARLPLHEALGSRQTFPTPSRLPPELLDLGKEEKKKRYFLFLVHAQRAVRLYLSALNFICCSYSSGNAINLLSDGTGPSSPAPHSASCFSATSRDVQ